MALSVDDLPNDIETLKALLVAAHAATETADARAAALATEVDRLTERAERLDHIVSVLRRAQFGRRSERITDDQIELALEDVETGFGVEDARVAAGSPTLRADAEKTRRANRGHLPKHLRARKSSLPRSVPTVPAAAATCTSSARMSPSASTRYRPGSR